MITTKDETAEGYLKVKCFQAAGNDLVAAKALYEWARSEEDLPLMHTAPTTGVPTHEQKIKSALAILAKGPKAAFDGEVWSVMHPCLSMKPHRLVKRAIDLISDALLAEPKDRPLLESVHPLKEEEQSPPRLHSQKSESLK